MLKYINITSCKLTVTNYNVLYNCTMYVLFKVLNGCSVNSFISSLAISYAMRPVKTLNKNTKNYFILYLSFQKTRLCSYGWVGLNTFPRWRKEIFRSSSPVAGTLTKLNRVHGGMHSITVTQKVQVCTKLACISEVY